MNFAFVLSVKNFVSFVFKNRVNTEFTKIFTKSTEKITRGLPHNSPTCRQS